LDGRCRSSRIAVGRGGKSNTKRTGLEQSRGRTRYLDLTPKAGSGRAFSNSSGGEKIGLCRKNQIDLEGDRVPAGSKGWAGRMASKEEKENRSSSQNVSVMRSFSRQVHKETSVKPQGMRRGTSVHLPRQYLRIGQKTFGQLLSGQPGLRKAHSRVIQELRFATLVQGNGTDALAPR